MPRCPLTSHQPPRDHSVLAFVLVCLCVDMKWTVQAALTEDVSREPQAPGPGLVVEQCPGPTQAAKDFLNACTGSAGGLLGTEG